LEDRYRVDSALTAAGGIKALEEFEYDVLLLDINLPDTNGLELLDQLNLLALCPPVIILTVSKDVRVVKRAIQSGAYDYIVKPYELDELEGTIRRAVQNSVSWKRFRREEARPSLEGIVGEGRRIQELKEWIARFGPSDAPVLIEGESGTGKELVARALHDLSSRRDAPFVALNCGAIPEGLLETELFGAERGAYTDAVSRPGAFERANGGTLFLDEVGEMPSSAQVKLLRVLEAKELCRVGSSRPIPLNLRILSATNRDLRQEMRAERFREDLYYRLSVLPIRTPPLRDCLEDLPLLAAFWLRRLGTERSRLHPAALEKLAKHSWPGNVRELRNVLERALLLAHDGAIRKRDILF
jgi:two-component system response regulator AtoC